MSRENTGRRFRACRTCGELLDGAGWDGECLVCADRTLEVENERE